LKNVIVNNKNTNRGVLVINSNKNSMLDAVTCNGIALVYNSTVAYTSYLEIKNYSLLDNVVTFDCNIFLFVRNHPAMVVVRISSTTFISNDKIHFLDAVFSHYGHRTYHEHRIQFINCYFRHNIIDSIVSAIGEEVKVCAVIVYIEFIDSQFISNRGKTQHSHVIDVVGGNIRMPKVACFIKIPMYNYLVL